MNKGSVTLAGKTLTFDFPDPELWKKSTVLLKTKLPLGQTTEDVANHFKEQAIWERPLDVKRVTKDLSSGVIYIIFGNHAG